MTKFKLDGDWPTEALVAVRPIIDSYEYLLPDWCATVFVTWDKWDVSEHKLLKHTIAYTNINYEYRSACINIQPVWFNESPEYRCEVIRHEIVHIVIGPLSDYASELFHQFFQGKEDLPPLLEAVKRELEGRCEAVTCDVTRITDQIIANGTTAKANGTKKPAKKGSRNGR